MKRHIAALAVILGTSWAIPAAAQDASTVVAKVNGAEITLGHLSVLRGQLPPQYQALPDETLFKLLLDQMIQQVALAEGSKGLVTRQDEMSMENDRRAYLAGVVLQEAVKLAITDEALQKAYDARFKDVAPATEYNASHILVESEELAKSLRAELDGGADFAELARKNSTDGSAQGGGNLGWFGKGAMVAPFEEAVVALEAGKIGGPIQTQFGWHLIKLNETRQAAAPSLEEAKPQLMGEIEQAAVEARIKAATDAATVERLDDGIDPAILKSDTLFGN